MIMRARVRANVCNVHDVEQMQFKTFGVSETEIVRTWKMHLANWLTQCDTFRACTTFIMSHHDAMQCNVCTTTAAPALSNDCRTFTSHLINK